MREIFETIFIIIYLIYAISAGVYLLKRRKNKPIKYMGIATLILGIGDSFHLIPRILNNIVAGDYTSYLGYGKLITSITMTIFYILLYYVYQMNYEVKNKKGYQIAIWILAITRIILCLFPGNNWGTNNSEQIWTIIRNIPFIILGLIISSLYYQLRNKNHTFKYIWFYIVLSFMFYIIVISGSSIPLLGLFMIPKTICYMLIILCFIKKIR